MAILKSGPVAWKDADVKSGGGTLFGRLDQGRTVIRVISQTPVQWYYHYIPNNIDGKPTKVRCTLDTDTCPACLKAKQAADPAQRSNWGVKPRWYVQAIDRKDGVCKIFELPSTIVKSIDVLGSDPNWGLLFKYDIAIVRGAPKSNPLYATNPLPPIPLTKEEKQLARDFIGKKSTKSGLLLIDELARAHTVEEVTAQLNLQGKQAQSGGDGSTSQPKSSQKSFQSTAFGDDEEDGDVDSAFQPATKSKSTPVDSVDGLSQDFLDEL